MKSNFEDWEKRMLARITELGFATFEDYLSARAGVAYGALANELGGFMPVMVEDMQMRRAAAAGESAKREAAMDSLVRVFREILVDGWGATATPGVEPGFTNIVAGSNWSAMLRRAGIAEESSDAIWNDLQKRAPAGWRPESTRDQIVASAFNAAWPVGSPAS